MNIILEILAKEVRKGKKRKKRVRNIRIEQEEAVLLVFVENKIKTLNIHERLQIEYD